MANTYKMNWKSKESNWSYELLIYQVGKTQLEHEFNSNYSSYYPANADAPDEIEEGTIQELALDWSYQESYPIGLQSAQNMKITLNLNNTTNTAFKRMLLYPFDDLNQDITVNDGARDYTFNYQYRLSNVYRLFCDFGGNDYKEIYIGIQKSGLGGNFELISGIVKIEIFDLNRCILESLNLKFLRELKYKGGTTRKCYLDWIYATDDGTYKEMKGTLNLPAADMTNKSNAWFWFFSVDFTFTFIGLVAQKIARILSRIDQLYYTINFDMPTYYKQTYDLSNNKGNAIDFMDLYFIGFVSNKQVDTTGSNYYGGLFYNSIENDYKTLWDYLKDFAIDNGIKFYFNITNTSGVYTLQGTTLTNTNTIFSDIESVDSFTKIDFKTDYEILKKVETASQETVGQDVAKVETQHNSSRSEKSYPAVVIHNNIPNSYDNDKNWKGMTPDIQPDTILAENPAGFNYADTYFSSNATFRFSWQNKIKGLFYFDTPTFNGHDITTFTVPIRIHSYCLYNFGNFDSSTANIFPYTQIDFSTMTKEQQPPGTAESITLQNNQSKNLALSKSLLAIFSRSNQVGLSGESKFYSFYNGTNSLWLNPDMNIEIDYTEYPNGDLISDYLNQFYLSKCEIDILKEIVKFESITIQEP